jgi:hypothetical protein
MTADNVGCPINRGAAPPNELAMPTDNSDNTIDTISIRIVGGTRVQKLVLKREVGVACHDDV